MTTTSNAHRHCPIAFPIDRPPFHGRPGSGAGRWRAGHGGAPPLDSSGEDGRADGFSDAPA